MPQRRKYGENLGTEDRNSQSYLHKENRWKLLAVGVCWRWAPWVGLHYLNADIGNLSEISMQKQCWETFFHTLCKHTWQWSGGTNPGLIVCFTPWPALWLFLCCLWALFDYSLWRKGLTSIFGMTRPWRSIRHPFSESNGCRQIRKPTSSCRPRFESLNKSVDRSHKNKKYR